MKPPRNYAEWSNLLDLLATGRHDEEILAAMDAGELSWTPGVAERFLQRLQEVLEKRLDDLAQQFQRDNLKWFEQTRSPQQALSRALLEARRKFDFLLRFSQIRPLPEEVRSKIKDILTDRIQQFQNDLTESAMKHDPSGRLASVIRKTPMVHENKALNSEPQSSNHQETKLVKRRRIILDG